MAVGDFFGGPDLGNGEYGDEDDADDLDSDLLRATSALMKDRPGSHYLNAKPFTADSFDSDIDREGRGGHVDDQAHIDAQQEQQRMFTPEGRNTLVVPGTVPGGFSGACDGESLPWASFDTQGTGGGGGGTGVGGGSRQATGKNNTTNRKNKKQAQPLTPDEFRQSAPPAAREAAANPLLRLPPTLPGVDAHINKAELRYVLLFTWVCSLMPIDGVTTKG
jgi:hypothetical protein